MRHKRNKLIELEVGVSQTRKGVVRTLLTNLVRDGKLTTTPKRAAILKAEADHFFARLMNLFTRFTDEADVKREAIRYVKSVLFTETEGKKVVNDMLPRYKQEGKKAGFVSDYKLGPRKGDGTEQIMLKLH